MLKLKLQYFGAFSKSSLNIWEFLVHVLLKPSLENFERYFTSVWDECNCAVVWAFWRRSTLGFLWKEWCWSWNSSTLATSCGELTHWKRLWCWEGLRAGGEGNDRGWDGWMVSLTWWTWVWVNSGSWWCRGRPGVLWFMGSQRVGHDWETELNWTEGFLLQSFSCRVSYLIPSVTY